MELTANKNGAELTVSVNGEVNTMTAPELSGLLEKELPGVQKLTLDFAKCDYVSSAGLRVLLSAHKLMSGKGGMKVTHVNEIVAEVFEVTGFSDILTIE